MSAQLRWATVVGIILGLAFGYAIGVIGKPFVMPFEMWFRASPINVLICAVLGAIAAACRSPAVRGKAACRMHGAGGGARTGNRNAHKHGLYSAEAIRDRRTVAALIRNSREVSGMA